MAEPSSVAEQVLKKVADQLTCAICLEDYKEPKLLQCFHVYCRKCLEWLVLRDAQGPLSLRCPSCRRSTLLPPSSVSGLQPAFHVHHWFEFRDTLVKVKKVKGPQKTQCEKCSEIMPLVSVATVGSLFAEFAPKFTKHGLSCPPTR